MTKRDIVASVILGKYKEFKEDCGFVQIFSSIGDSTQWTDEFLQDMMQEDKSTTKKFHIINIEPLICKELPQYLVSLKYKEIHKRNSLIFSEKTGLFKITFNDNSIMLYAKWISGGGKSTTIEHVFATEASVWKNWLKLFQESYKKRQKPKTGVYRIYLDSRGFLVYEPIKNIQTIDIFHETLEPIKESINYYFDNVKSFMKFNQSGRRSSLLYGEPGTGKTSILYQVALLHYKTKSVVFSTDISAIAVHVQACEKYNIPTIGCLEDAEGAFRTNHSGVKNFLSGMDAGKNKSGTYLLYTTNYPEFMEETILERPERIDELFHVGPISGNTLVQCAKFYFGDLLPESVNLFNVLKTPMTGAEVKLIVQNTLRVCASKQMELTESSIDYVLNQYSKDIKKLHDFSAKSKKTTYAKTSNDTGMGFILQAEPEYRGFNSR